MIRYFEDREVRKEFVAHHDEPEDEGMGTSKRLGEQLKGFLRPSPTAVTCRRSPDNFSLQDASGPSCMQLSLSGVLSMADNNSSLPMSAQLQSIASLEAEEVSCCDLSRTSVISDSMDSQPEDTRQKQAEVTATETKKRKKKKKSRNKIITITKPSEASTRHHHGQDQDQAISRDGSQRSTTNEPLWKAPVAIPSSAKHKKEKRKSINQGRPVFYVNVVLEDDSEVIRGEVSQKLEDSNLPPPLKKRLGSWATNNVSANMIVEKMIPDMLAEMPVKMKRKGLTIHAEEVFRDGPYFVLVLQVQHVDKVTMVEAKQLEGNGQGEAGVKIKVVSSILNLMGLKLAGSVQRDCLPALIQAKMKPDMCEMLEGEMAETNMKASVEVLPEESQARFSCELLQHVRESEAAKSAKKKGPQDRQVLYVNVVLEDASEVIRGKVSQKLEDSNLLPPLKKRLAKYVGNFAADNVSANMIVEKMIPNMLAEMPVKMKRKGLTVHVEEVCRDGPYFVIMMQVQHVDISTMMEVKQLEDNSQCKEGVLIKVVKFILNLMGLKLADSVQRDYLPALIQAKMQPDMGEMMQGEMAEKNMKASVEVLPEESQARFFFGLLQQVREAEAPESTNQKKGRQNSFMVFSSEKSS